MQRQSCQGAKYNVCYAVEIDEQCRGCYYHNTGVRPYDINEAMLAVLKVVSDLVEDDGCKEVFGHEVKAFDDAGYSVKHGVVAGAAIPSAAESGGAGAVVGVEAAAAAGAAVGGVEQLQQQEVEQEVRCSMALRD
jgi:hypothetical protein